MMKMHSIGYERAMALASRKTHNRSWWEGKTSKELVDFQLFTAEMCMPFSVFHEAIKKELKRPVFTHEFGLNYDGIVKEYLGERPAPTLQEIIEQIPTEKSVLVFVNLATDERKYAKKKSSATVMKVDLSKHSAEEIADAVDKVIRASESKDAKK
jgi:hypothetical protein